MTRFSCFSLVILLAGQSALQAQAQNAPKYFQNSVGMKFVWIEPGTFDMGSPTTEKGRKSNEIRHRVKLTQGFYMGVYPVTQEQWYAAIVPGYKTPAEGFDLSKPSRFLGDKNMPVDSVSWDDCQILIKKLRAREKDKHHYRLPTEAEWEYACRAGTNTAFYFGDEISTSQANFSGAGVDFQGRKEINRKKTTPVGSFSPNAWGLYDMHGNVSQWCQDRYANYPQQSVVNPQGPDKQRGSRVLRGGSWEDGPANCRSACRAWDSPDNRGQGTFGVRLCFSLE
jgi:formylglycine-generating enzyme